MDKLARILKISCRQRESHILCLLIHNNKQTIWWWTSGASGASGPGPDLIVSVWFSDKVSGIWWLTILIARWTLRRISSPLACSLLTPTPTDSSIFYRFLNFSCHVNQNLYLFRNVFRFLSEEDDFEYWREIHDNKSIKVVLQKFLWSYKIKQNVKQVFSL